MDILKKYWWVFLLLIVIIIIIVVMMNRKSSTTTINVPNPVTSQQPTNNIAQIIAALGGLSASVGSWGIFNGNNSGSGIGGS